MTVMTYFERAVRREFAFLVRDLSFEAPAVNSRGDQYTLLQYVKGSAAVTANFDMEETILVTVTMWDGPARPDQPFDAKIGFAIDALAAYRNSSWIPPRQPRINAREPGLDGWTDEHIDRVVSAYASAVREYASGLLAGDSFGLAEFLALHPSEDFGVKSFLSELEQRSPKGQDELERFIREWTERQR
jgi:hypothetical protein